jgi:DNA adenine methylase
LGIVKYPGGKGCAGTYQRIINLIPPHDVYIETHLGGGNVMERKTPAPVNIGIDVDRSLIAIWNDRRRHLPFALTLLEADAVDFLRGYKFSGSEFVYSDPPYMLSTRTKQKIYRHEYTEAQHIELLGVLVSLPCAAMVSGYPSPLYRDVLQHGHGWRCHEFQAMTRRGLRTECLWFNYEPGALHDSRFVGANYRERERIKRMKSRWRRRLLAMPPAERQALLKELNGIQSPLQPMPQVSGIPSPSPQVADPATVLPPVPAGTIKDESYDSR